MTSSTQELQWEGRGWCPCALMATECQASMRSTRQSPWCLGWSPRRTSLAWSQEWGGGEMFYFSQSYSKSSDLTSAKGNRSQIWHFPDAGEIGCGIADLSLMRHVPTLLKTGIQTVGAGRKRQVAVVENKKKETSPLLQRHRKLNEPFISSPFPQEKWLRSFIFHCLLLPLFTARKRKRQPIKYLMWKSWSLSLCRGISHSHVFIFLFSFHMLSGSLINC